VSEEMLSRYPKLLAYFVEDLLYEKKMPNSKEIAYSIAVRHQLLENNLLDKQDSINELNLMKTKNP
jgi:hypothetical protein